MIRKEFKIGLAGIAALIILFCGIKYLKGINLFRPESYYLVEFTDISGLAQSSPVFANGYKVGLVRDIRYNYQDPGHVIVGIELEEAMKIPEGSHAELVSDMLGTVKMNLIFDHSQTTFLNEHDTIPGRVNAGLLGAAEADILPGIKSMLPKLDSIMSSLDRLLADPALAQTLHNAERLTASLDKASQQLNKLMQTDIPQLTGNAVAITNDLKTITNNLQTVDYASTLAKVDSTLENVRLFTAKLNQKDNTLGLILNDSCFYYNLNQTAANAASLLDDLKNHPKRYVHFSLFGRKEK